MDALLLQLLDLEEHLGQVALEQLLVQVRLGVGLGDEAVAVLGVAQVEVVEVEALLPAALHQHAQLHPQRIEGQVLADAAHPPLTRAEGEGQLVGLDRRLRRGVAGGGASAGTAIVGGFFSLTASAGGVRTAAKGEGDSTGGAGAFSGAASSAVDADGVAGMVGDECAQASPPVSRAIANATRASRLKRATSLMSWPSGSFARATTIPRDSNSSASPRRPPRCRLGSLS